MLFRAAAAILTTADPEITHSPGERFRWFDTLAGAAAFALVAGIAVWLIASPFPRLQDLPEWMYQGHLIARLLQGDADAGALVRFAPYLPPNALCQLILGALNLLMPPLTAGLVLVLGYLAAFLALAVVIARDTASAGTRGQLLLLLVGIFALNLGFWKGLINYQAGLLVFGTFVWLWTIKGRRSLWLLLGTSILVFMAHATVFAVFVLYVLLDDMLRDAGRWFSLPRLTTLASLAPSILLLVGYAVGNATQFNPTPSDGPLVVEDTLGRLIAYKFYTVMKLGPMRTFEPEKGLSFLSGRPTLYWLGVGLNGAFVTCLGLAIAAGLWRRARRGRWRGGAMLPLALVVCVAPVVALAPPTIFHVNDLGERMLIPTILAVIATTPLPQAGLRVLAVIILGVLPLTVSYLINPYLMVDRTADPEAQIYFTARSNQFAKHYPWLVSDETQPPRRIIFDTSVLLKQPPKPESTP